jgi:hypothetical protein
MSDDTQDQTIQTAPADEAQAAQPQLQLSDILGAAQIIQLASSRGAFKAEEFTQIGGVYERLMGFLQATGAIKPVETPEGN